MINPPYPELDELLEMMGQVGKRLAEIKACEGAAGNISVCIRWPIKPNASFPVSNTIDLSQRVPELAGATFLVTGSGRRLREIIDDPLANIACIRVNEGGKTGLLQTSSRCRFERVTSEFNSHLAIHYSQMVSTGTNFHTAIHAQPIYLTFLSHIPRYQDELYLNQHLLHWQPETIINLPEGIGFIPFRIPGSPELMAANTDCLSNHQIAVWAKHGVMARSDTSVMHAVDLIEYAETAARYEYLNLTVGEAGEGLNSEEIRSICATLHISQGIF